MPSRIPSILRTWDRSWKALGNLIERHDGRCPHPFVKGSQDHAEVRAVQEDARRDSLPLEFLAQLGEQPPAGPAPLQQQRDILQSLDPEGPIGRRLDQIVWYTA